jgi:dTDP-4-dehydrorhamnose reductase
MVWVVGSNGMLAKDLLKVLETNLIPYVSSNSIIDVRDKNVLNYFIQNKEITAIINCAAYTNVDGAEDNQKEAFDVNAFGVSNLAEIARERDIPLYHISTDYVFPGDVDKPLKEIDPTDPKGVYGRSKLVGEDMIKSICPKHFIIRTSWLYGEHGNNFVYTMLKLMSDKDEIGVVSDQWGTPTWTFNLANAIVTMLEEDSDKYGVYHYSNEGKTNWHEFAVHINLMSDLVGECTVNPITTEDYPTKAVRPQYSVLSKEKIKDTFGLAIPEWGSSLRAFMDTIREKVEYREYSKEQIRDLSRYLRDRLPEPSQQFNFQDEPRTSVDFLMSINYSLEEIIRGYETYKRHALFFESAKKFQENGLKHRHSVGVALFCSDVKLPLIINHTDRITRLTAAWRLERCL